jgi:hydrogenase large subunit
MATVITLDPVTRLEGHLRVEVAIENNQVVEARTTGTLFRGFESILTGRDPWDGPQITQRICGVCPIPHAQAAVLAMEQAAGHIIPNNARIMRNLVLGANFVQSHLLHFYHLAVLDYLAGPTMPPWQPQWNVDFRIDPGQTEVLVGHYVQALSMTRRAHEMGALFGGRMPIAAAHIPGGFTTTPTADQIAQFKAHCSELLAFIQDVYIPDVEVLSKVYEDYFTIGKGYRNLLAFGAFELSADGTKKLFRQGRVVRGRKLATRVLTSAITEKVTRSWYDDSTNNLNPAAGATVPVHPKADAYSWLKAPRYAGEPHEVGPLARMIVNGLYRYSVSVMDRHLARAIEAYHVAQEMLRWVDQIAVGQSPYTNYVTPANATGIGLTEAPRGALGHWLQISGGKIAHYQIVTPTCWNASPRDDLDKPGPIEQALVGTPVADPSQPVEVLRVVHSFDPCMSCAVHVMKPSAHSFVSMYVPEKSSP